MNRRFILLFFIIVASAATLTSFKGKQVSKLNGIWIPKKINWKDGSFNTIYVYNDTSFIIVASSQSRNKNGTINFMAEEGFILSYGHISRNETHNKYTILYRLLHRSVALSEEKLPSDIINGLFILTEMPKNKVELSFNNERYSKTNLYTAVSIEKMKALKNKLVPQLLKENKLPE